MIGHRRRPHSARIWANIGSKVRPRLPDTAPSHRTAQVAPSLVLIRALCCRIRPDVWLDFRPHVRPCLDTMRLAPRASNASENNACRPCADRDTLEMAVS